MQGWRSRIAGGDLSLPGQCERWPAGTQLDSIYGPEGSASFVMDSPHLPTCTHTDVVQQASASDASTDGAGEEAESFEQLGGTLVVAPPSVVKAVWARELASKVMTTPWVLHTFISHRQVLSLPREWPHCSTHG